MGQGIKCYRADPDDSISWCFWYKAVELLNVAPVAAFFITITAPIDLQSFIKPVAGLSSLCNSIMSSTSYYPLDSDAPSYFRATQISNCLNGEWYLGHVMSWTSSEFFLLAAFLVSSHFRPKFCFSVHTRALDIALVRSCYHFGQGGMIRVIYIRR